MSAKFCMIDMSHEISFDNAPAPGESISDKGTLRAEDYFNMEELGSGGFALVFKAQSKVDESFYAIKVMPRSDDECCPQDEMITNEINILEGLNHPSIMGYSGFYCLNYECHLVCEYAAGGDLKHRSLISKKEAKIYIMDVAKALEHLHQNRIIHRDVKLENVLLTLDNRVKLADFGLAVKTSTEYITGDCGSPHSRGI